MSLKDLSNNQRDCFENPAIENVMLGLALTIGILISYLPQYVTIIRSRTSEGVNYWTIWLLYMSSIMTLINAIVLKWSYFQCCRYLSGWEVIEELLPIEQLTAGPVMTSGIYFLVVLYFSVLPQTPEESIINKRYLHRKIAWGLFIIMVIFTLALIALSLILIFFVGDSSNEGVKGYADAIGIISALIVTVVWIPQIYTTWKKKDPGTLSIIMLLIQMPGSVIVVIYQGILNNADWTTWLPYSCTAVELTILIVMWFWYKYFSVAAKNKKKLALEKEAEDKRSLLDPEVAGDLEDSSLSDSQPIGIRGRDSKRNLDSGSNSLKMGIVSPRGSIN